MEITTENLGRKFVRQWIFRNLNLKFESGQSYAILGVNGSGKSTLIKVLSGAMPLSEGKISYRKDHREIDANSFFQHITVSAPYIELIEELTLLEFLKFHFQFKAIREGSVESIIEKMELQHAAHKEIKYFSSGMKQRVKLGLCFFSECDVIFLDEPTTNLDIKGIDWYLAQIETLPKDMLPIVCSNREIEYKFCTNHIILKP